VDLEFQRRLISVDFEKLKRRIGEDRTLNIHPEWVSGVLFVRMFGPGGAAEPYLAKIEPWLYPVGPWRVGFIDPGATGEQRLNAPDRDPRFWPYSQMPGVFGGFHVHYEAEHRVFVCLPFTTEFFHYHGDQRWEPHVFDLHRVVLDLNEAVNKGVHFSIWRGMIYGAA
jgi:hypothetical protein